MSISYKKISELIDNKSSLIEDVNQDQRKYIADLCKKIYMIESSVESISNQKMIDDISGEITKATTILQDIRN
ncbi:hypothetical protein [Thiothrix fructosivorans]|uniref:Uncharacterized protein n=1 Tax=Thiothrix fructosivorans TaxID=111770 RepID=A0A8B0SQP8_9GAMM|nr:hypothetical protein [Thiothrix fructosivorans]MBO0612506.1 hypothetical protein [Thiothrix fructosivorans]QTX12017.1 hypothetical protein J1836_006705 [Thiothrix fructosivorans]